MKSALLFIILIQISGETIQTCPKYCTCKLGAQAEWLRVKCGNELQSIKDVDVSTVSVELVHLDLSKNNIYVIETDIFKDLINLKRLNLSQNNINAIDEGCFNGLGKLERLDLSKNQISTVGAYTFRNLLNLKRLKLNHNKLTTLQEGTFYSLKFLKQLDLSDNPWRCDCELYWLSHWIHNNSIKLNPTTKCAAPPNIKGEFIKKLKYSENIQCQWLPPTVELQPIHNQVVFAGDSITLKCRAPSITKDRNAKLSWLWHPNITTENINLDAFRDPQTSLSNIKVDNRYLADSGIVDSSLSIIPVAEEHNGQWNCLLVSVNGNRSKTINVIVISNETRYCPLVVTKNNKGIYAWPKTVVGWRAELPCEGNVFSDPLQISLKASYQCNNTGYWENLNTDSCPYVSHTTKSLEQFSKVNLSLTRINLLETVKKFKNYTENVVEITDPVEVHYITHTIEKYLSFLNEQQELGIMLIDIISSLFNVSQNIFKIAEISFKSCTRLIKSVEKIVKYSQSIQIYKKNMALEEFRVKKDSFSGLICTWYSNNNPEVRFLQCTTNNRTSINVKDRIIEASIQIPASLLQYSQDTVAHQLMISVYSNNRLFPKVRNDNMDITSAVIGSKLFGLSVQNLTEPVYVMLKAPYYYAGNKLLPAVWDETLNKSGGWTNDGCHLRNVLNDLIVFYCNRLGYYALMQDTTLLHLNNNRLTSVTFKYLNPLIYIGSITTTICLVTMSITYIVCYTSISMPKKAKHCVINTWFAMAFLLFFYSVGIYQTENSQICQAIGLILHYLSLCPLLWMSVFASNMYKKLTKSVVEDISDTEPQDEPVSKPLLGLYLVGWGIAMIICGISGAINLHEYAGYTYCFLTSGPTLAALFLPAGILVLYLIVSSLRIKCAIKNVDVNTQLSEGTQATENMDLELLEPGKNSYMDRNSIHSAQTVSSDIEDPEHTQVMQLKGQIIMLFLYLISWVAIAAATTRPLSAHISFDDTIFAALYTFSSTSLGSFIVFFYGVARNDVKLQWIQMHCWFQKRKSKWCRTRSVSDANSAIPTQSLVQNLVAPVSNSQATQVTSDSNSLTSSKYTNGSETCAALKFVDVTSQRLTPIGRKMTSVNLLVLHRQQYRYDNVSTCIEPTCVEMFYNPYQSGVARRFFRKQRRHTKNSNLGPRKQNSDVMEDVTSCMSVPRPTAKVESNIDQTMLNSSAKVNNINIHIELNPINDIRNVNILSDSGGSLSEEKCVPMRLIIEQDGLFQTVRKINNGCKLQDLSIVRSTTQKNKWPEIELLNTVLNDSNINSNIAETKHPKTVSHQCNLDYSSRIESNTEIAGAENDHTLPEIAKPILKPKFLKKGCQSRYTLHEEDNRYSKSTLRWLTHFNSTLSLSVDTVKPLKINCCNSLNDISSLTRLRNCEYLQSLTDLHGITSVNFYNKVFPSQPSNKLKLSSEKNSVTDSDLCNLVQDATNVNTSIGIERAFSVCSEDSNIKREFVNSVTDITKSMSSSVDILNCIGSNKEMQNINTLQKVHNVKIFKMDTSKRETSV